MKQPTTARRALMKAFASALVSVVIAVPMRAMADEGGARRAPAQYRSLVKMGTEGRALVPPVRDFGPAEDRNGSKPVVLWSSTRFPLRPQNPTSTH
jgi:hypothetical protein